jgi:hypothetical protein
MKNTGKTFIIVDRINNIYFRRIQGALQATAPKSITPIYHAARMGNKEIEDNKEKLIS